MGYDDEDAPSRGAWMGKGMGKGGKGMGKGKGKGKGLGLEWDDGLEDEPATALC